MRWEITNHWPAKELTLSDIVQPRPNNERTRDLWDLAYSIFYPDGCDQLLTQPSRSMGPLFHTVFGEDFYGG